MRRTKYLGFVAIDIIVLRLTFPVLVVGLAVIAQGCDLGLLNIMETPGGGAVLASIIGLDLVIYLQHVMFHAVPALRRLHRMDQADLEFDVSTGLRFHPVEVLLSMGIMLAMVMALGPPAVAGSGPVAFLCRPKCSFKPLFVRRRPGFSGPVLSGVVADDRTR